MPAFPRISVSRATWGTMPDNDDGDTPKAPLRAGSASEGWTQKEAHETLPSAFSEMAERHNTKQVLKLARGLVYKVQTLIENK